MTTIDLHTHSTCSDGSLTPTALIDTALSFNISALSITDHDTMAATTIALDYCQAKPITYIPGVEISTHLNNLSLHLLGYQLDHNSAELSQFLGMVQESRKERNEKIFARLGRLGISLSLKDISQHMETSQIGRPHIAQLLVKKRIVSSEQEAFSRYLKKNAAAYVQRQIMPTADAIRVIRKAGGCAVFAHPASLGVSEQTLSTLIKELKGDGLCGIEVYHPLHSDKLIRFLKTLCHTHRLIETGGSDFHGRARDKAQLGTYGYNKPIPATIDLGKNP